MNTDGTENLKDSSAKQDSSDGKQETSENTKTYQESEVQKIVNDRLAQAGREAKVFEQQSADLKKREEVISQREKEKEEEEYEKIRGNPDAISDWESKRNLRTEKKAIADKEAAFERDKVEQQIKIDAANSILNELKINELAEKYKLDASILKSFALDIETTEKVAQQMTTIPKDELTKSVVPVKDKKTRDSGVTVGGGTGLGDLSPKDRLKEIDRQLRNQ